MRQPFQVLIFPYIKNDNNFLFAIFKREDMGIWQGLAGGGEEGELPVDAAKRESQEEAQLPLDSVFCRLASIATIPVEDIHGFIWGPEIVVIPEYSFGVELKSKKLVIGKEHDAYKWVNFKDALSVLNWDSNKTAMRELNYRLLNGEIDSVAKNNSIVKYRD